VDQINVLPIEIATQARQRSQYRSLRDDIDYMPQWRQRRACVTIRPGQDLREAIWREPAKKLPRTYALLPADRAIE